MYECVSEFLYELTLAKEGGSVVECVFAHTLTIILYSFTVWKSCSDYSEDRAVCVCVWWGCRSRGLISDQIIRFAIISAAAMWGSGRLKPGLGLVNIHEGTRVRARGLDCSSKTFLQLMGL